MVKLPLVLGTQGQIQRLQPGDSISAAAQFSATNGDVTGHNAGTFVYISSATTVQAAVANSAVTAKAVAVSTGTVAPSGLGSYQTDGIVGGLTGIVPGSTYFLSPTTAGAYTTTAPSANGQWCLPVGTGYSTTEIEIAFGVPVQL